MIEGPIQCMLVKELKFVPDLDTYYEMFQFNDDFVFTWSSETFDAETIQAEINEED